MEAETTPAKISIDDFRKIELKVATIKSAEAHPNADKLLVLQIDLGGEQRQICAGIRNSYTPEELVGQQIVVVANLETAKLRGLESQGMLLAASDDGRVIIMTPEKSVQAGAGLAHLFPGRFLKRASAGHAYTSPYLFVSYLF